MKMVSIAAIGSLGFMITCTTQPATAMEPRGTMSQNKLTQTTTPRAGSPMAKHPFYFEMADEQRQIFIKKVQQIELGVTRQAVKDLLGKPDIDDLTGPKERPRPTGRRVRYYLRKYDKDLTNERLDEWATFRFDMTDHLVSIESNVLGIHSRP